MEEGGGTDGGIANKGGVMKEGGICIMDKPHSCFWWGGWMQQW